MGRVSSGDVEMSLNVKDDSSIPTFHGWQEGLEPPKDGRHTELRRTGFKVSSTTSASDTRRDAYPL